MATDKDLNTFDIFLKPDGEWGYFHYYNPILSDFAFLPVYEDNNTSLENWWFYRLYQKYPLSILFPEHENYFELGNEIPTRIWKKLLKELNYKTELLIQKSIVINNRLIKQDNQEIEIASLSVLYDLENLQTKTDIMSTEANWNKQNPDLPFKEAVAIHVLLLADNILKMCHFVFIDDLHFTILYLQQLLQLLSPHFKTYSAQNYKQYLSQRGSINAKRKYEKNYLPLKEYAIAQYKQAILKEPNISKAKVAKQVIQNIESGLGPKYKGTPLRFASENPQSTILKWLYKKNTASAKEE